MRIALGDWRESVGETMIAPASRGNMGVGGGGADHFAQSGILSEEVSDGLLRL
jgi:hypothetical protein